MVIEENQITGPLLSNLIGTDIEMKRILNSVTDLFNSSAAADKASNENSQEFECNSQNSSSVIESESEEDCDNREELLLPQYSSSYSSSEDGSVQSKSSTSFFIDNLLFNRKVMKT